MEQGDKTETRTGYSAETLRRLASWFDPTGYLMINSARRLATDRSFATILLTKTNDREESLEVHHMAPDRSWPVGVGGTSSQPRRFYQVPVVISKARDLLLDMQPYVHVQKRSLEIMIRALADYEIIKDPQFLPEDPIVKRAKRRIQRARRDLRAANQQASRRKRELRRQLAEIKKHEQEIQP